MGWIARPQQHPLAHSAQLLDREIPIYHCDDHRMIRWLDRAIHDQGIAVMDAELQHGVALDPDQKRRFGVADQMFVEVDPPDRVVIGR